MPLSNRVSLLMVIVAVNWIGTITAIGDLQAYNDPLHSYSEVADTATTVRYLREQQPQTQKKDEVAEERDLSFLLLKYLSASKVSTAVEKVPSTLNKIPSNVNPAQLKKLQGAVVKEVAKDPKKWPLFKKAIAVTYGGAVAAWLGYTVYDLTGDEGL